MAHFEAYIHKFNMGILVDAHSKQKNEPEQFKHVLLEFLVMIWAQKSHFLAQNLNFLIFLCMNTPSVIHHWKGMAMSIHNPFCLNLYDIPISAQNFGDTSGIQCNLYLT